MIEQKCNACKVIKPMCDYNKNKTRKSGYNYSCKECQKVWTKASQYNNKPSTKRQQNNRAFMNRYKMFCGCYQCGYKGHPAALDFDHKDPDWKKNNRNATTGSERYSGVRRDWGRERIKTEIRQCRVLCSNCHRIKTHG